MRRRSRASLLAVGPAVWLFTASGCAGTPPREALASADTMVRRAEQDGATQFAPLPLRKAKDKLEKAQSEMNESEYTKARRLAEQAEVDARLASVETERARTQNTVRELSRTLQAMETDIGLQQGGAALPPVSAPPAASPSGAPTSPTPDPLPRRPESR